jgi:hypothetical protein
VTNPAYFVRHDNQYNGKKKLNGIGIFPTGYGKSVCFQIVPLVHDENYGEKHIGLVISPLRKVKHKDIFCAVSKVFDRVKTVALWSAKKKYI